MRVEQVQNNLQQQSQVQNEPQLPASFQKGEVVKATVLAQDGDTFTLRTEDGRLFKAKLQLDTVLLPQDQVEFVVTAKGGGQMSMQMLSIISSGEAAARPAAGSGLLESLGLQEHPGASAILDAMQQMGVNTNKQTLLNALQIMQDTGLSPKAAVFFAANQIPATAENVKAFLEIQQGQTTGVVLHEIAQEAATLEGQPAPIPQQETPGQAPPAGQPLDAGQAAPQQPAAQAPVQAEAVPIPGEAAPPPELQGQVVQQEGREAQAPATNTPAPEQAPPSQAGAQASQAPQSQAPAQERELQTLSGRLLSMFMEIDAEMDGAKVKKAAAETAMRSELLKDMMQSTGGRSSIAERMGDVAAQTKLTQDVQRFYCLHIPIQHQSPDTAELYIYKNRKGGRKIDPEDTSILIGLHTETMGRVESLIRVEKRNISLVFSVENEDAVPFIREHSKALYPLLREHRYTLIDTKVHKLEQATTLETAEEVLTSAVSKPHVYVDTKI